MPLLALPTIINLSRHPPGPATAHISFLFTLRLNPVWLLHLVLHSCQPVSNDLPAMKQLSVSELLAASAVVDHTLLLKLLLLCPL